MSGAFKSQMLSAGQSSFNSTRGVAVANPSPAPPNASSSMGLSIKSRPGESSRPKSDGIYSQPSDTGAGKKLTTQILLAIKYLKEKQKPVSFVDLISYLSLLDMPKHHYQIFARALRDNPHVSFEEKETDEQGLYSFKSKYGIKNPDQLLAYLQQMPTFKGLLAHDINEGWPNSEAAIRGLENEHKLLVLRSRKDDKAKMVWPDDPTLSTPVDAEFRDMWSRIKLPDPEATAAQLERNGLVPTNKSKKVKVAPKTQEKKPRKSKKGGKVTNVHMQHLLKDYSTFRK